MFTRTYQLLLFLGTFLIVASTGCMKTLHLSIDQVARPNSSEIIAISLKSGESIDCAKHGCQYDSTVGSIGGIASDGTSFSEELKDIAFVKIVSTATGSIPLSLTASDFREDFDFLVANQKNYRVRSATLNSGSEVVPSVIGSPYRTIEHRGKLSGTVTRQHRNNK
jgi:hypothetical protein